MILGEVMTEQFRVLSQQSFIIRIIFNSCNQTSYFGRTKGRTRRLVLYAFSA